MRKVLVFLLAISLFGTLFGSDKVTKEIKVNAGEKLEVDLDTGGDIEVTGWEKNLVSVIVFIEDYDKEDYDISIEKYSKGVSVNIDSRRHHRRSGNLVAKINVPSKFDLELKTMGGDVKIESVGGMIEGETMGGDLVLTKLNGKIEFSTMGGDIYLKNSELDGEVSTMGGDVEFEDVIGDVKGSSMGGDVVYKNVKKKDGRSTGKEVNISTMGGEINVDEALFGANVSTMGGDIHIRKAGKYIKAKTMGGDIQIDKIDGSVTTSTMGGDVEVTMVGDPDQGDREVDISSLGGDLRLTVPAGLSMEFDIKLSYTRRGSEYKIISDFPIKIEESDDWDYSQGSKRKYIYGKGEVNGGKHRIRLDTINGNIYILKGK
ncbi:DUF4097 domain-containing protein [Calditrichota bacterium]